MTLLPAYAGFEFRGDSARHREPYLGRLWEPHTAVKFTISSAAFDRKRGTLIKTGVSPQPISFILRPVE